MSSGFITETEIAEKRKTRQEEWEKVRQPNQPLDAPEEEYDHRSLYERLQEQKQKKDYEYEEAHRLKNMIKGLDDDEVEFLELVDRSKMEEERKKSVEEEKEMADFRNKVASLQEKSLDQRIQNEIKKPSVTRPTNLSLNRSSQTKLLAGALVKKRPLDQTSPEKPKEEEGKGVKRPAEDEDADVKKPALAKGSLTCIGILPGLGTYENSSEDDSDESSEAEEGPSRYDLLGRRIEEKVKSVSAE